MPTQVTLEEFSAEWLTDVRAGNPSTTELGHRFARKLLTQWLDIGEVSDDIVYCDGAGDGGIDIAYLSRSEGGDGGDSGVVEGDTWYLVQSKYGSAFQGTGTLLIEGQKVIDTLDGRRTRLSSLAEGLLERLTLFRGQALEGRDRLILVYATEKALTDEQKRALNDIRAMGRQRLGPLFDVEAISIANIYERSLEATDTLEQIRIPIRAQLVSAGDDLRVGAIFLLDLYDFLQRYRNHTGDLDQLFERNVRRFLGVRGRVNKAIQETLQQAPDRFGLYNNGITVVVNDFHSEADGTILLTEPYVVNGCQTTRTIWEVFYRHLEAGGSGTNPELQAWRQKAAQGSAVIKVVKVGATGEDLLQAITRYTNTQNAIREKDFLALTADFRNWAAQMADRYGIFLEIQRGGWDSRRALQRQNPDLIQYSESANAFDLLKVYGAGWLGEAGTAYGRNAAFLPNGTIFRRIMNGDGNAPAFAVDDLYAAFQLQRAADKYHFGRGAPSLTRRQTRFLYYMIVVELLRDVMNRGGMPTTPRDFTNALSKLFDPANQTAANALLDNAVELVDEYLTDGRDDCVFCEPAFRNVYNSDLNGFLKWEQLGKTEDASPRLRSLIAMYRTVLGRATGGQPSPRALIAEAIRV